MKNRFFKKETFNLFFILFAFFVIFIFSSVQKAFSQVPLTYVCCHKIISQDKICQTFSADTGCPSLQWEQVSGLQLSCAELEGANNQAYKQLCHIAGVPSQSTQSEMKYQSGPPIVPQLSVPIPGLNLTSDANTLRVCAECGEAVSEGEKCPEDKCARWTYTIPWLGEYIYSFYKWAVSVIAILAVLIIVYSAFNMVTAAGNASKIQSAESSLWAAIIGLFLILIVHQILAMVDPRLVVLKPIVIGSIEKTPYEFLGYLDDSPMEANSLQCAQESDLSLINDSPNIVFTSTQSVPKLRKETAAKLKLAAQKLFASKNMKLQVNNAFRTMEEQISLCNDGRERNLASCPPKSSGKSCKEVACNDCPHTLGYGVDVACQGKNARENDSCGLTAIMREVGFCQLASEAWHFEYPKMSRTCN